ncbi:MAG: YncE family protein [Steroidobacteraceae bacterium]
MISITCNPFRATQSRHEASTMKALLSAILLAAVSPLPAFAVSAPLAPQSVIKVPGGEHGVGFDDIGYAAPLHRVTVPAGATGNLVMIDPVTDALTVIPGVAAAPADAKGRREGTSSAVYAEGYLFASDHDPAEVVAINPHTRKIVGRTKLESGPDYVRYAARTHEIWVTEPAKQQIQVFKLAVALGPVLTSQAVIHIAGGPESLEIDNRRNRAYSNLWRSKTVEMELSTHEVLAEWPNTCGGSHGIAIDETHDHVFVACGEGKVVTLAPGDQGKILASAPAGTGIDIISYSPRLHHLYVPGARAATLTIFDVAPSGRLTSLAVYRTAERAHCVTDDNDGHVFVCDPPAGAILKIDDR